MQKLIKIGIIFVVVLAVVAGVFAVLNRPSPSRGAAEDMLKKIAKKDATGSYALTSPNLRNVSTQEAWTAFVTKEQTKLAKGYTFSKEEKSSDTSSMITYITKTTPVAYEVLVGVEKIEGSWKVSYVSTSIQQKTTTKEASK